MRRTHPRLCGLLSKSPTTKAGASFLRVNEAHAPRGPVGSLADVSSAGPYIDGVQGLAGDHEETISPRASEADIGADLRQHDHADALPGRRKNLDAIVARAAAAGAGPDVAIHVGANSVGQARRFARHLHIGELLLVTAGLAIHHIEHLNVSGI